MGIENIPVLSEPKTLDSPIGEGAKEYFCALDGKDALPSTEFKQFFLNEAKSWREVVERFSSEPLGKEGVKGSTLRAMMQASVVDNVYQHVLAEIADSARKAGLLRVPNDVAQEEIESWRR